MMTGEEKNDVVNEEGGGNDNTDVTSESKRKCCSFFNGNTDAIGYTWLAVGRGMMVMSNIFMSTSLLWLASKAAGCDPDNGEGPCKNKVNGFLPSSLITNIAVISGLVASCMMPIFGAYVDYTPHRHKIGVISAALMTVIQGVQIYTVESTWFVMACLQALAIVVYQLQVVTVFAYLPEMARQVGEKQITTYSSHFTAFQFCGQTFFLLIIAIISFAFEPSTVLTAQISQGINTVTCVLFFSLGWFKYMSLRPAKHDLPPGGHLCTVGFRQVWNTAVTIQRHFKKGLRWYFLALSFAEASAAAVTTISIVYLNDTLRMSSTEISLFFFAVLIACPLGAYLGRVITLRSNPNISWKISMVVTFFVLLTGTLVLEVVHLGYSYLWGFSVGICLGWFYATENLFFATCLPKGQEAEFGGFYVFCSQILVWLPPLLFTVCMENNVEQKFALISTASFFLVAAVLLMFTASWDEIVEEAAIGVVTLGMGDDGAISTSKIAETSISKDETK